MNVYKVFDKKANSHPWRMAGMNISRTGKVWRMAAHVKNSFRLAYWRQSIPDSLEVVEYELKEVRRIPARDFVG